MQAQINLINGDKIGTETDYRDYLPVNMHAVLRPIFGTAGYMIQEPGLRQYATGYGIDRGGIWNERQIDHFRVSGNDFISITAEGVVTSLGSISGIDSVSLPYSFNTQGIVADGKFYLYDPTNGFREVTDSDLGNPIDCVWVDGYYFFTDGEYIYHSDITDESSIDPLKFATAEFMPDPSLGVAKTQDNKVIVFGRYTTEYFVNVAQENFAFQRVATRAIKIGIVGTHAKAEAGDAWFILGSRKEEAISVHRLGIGASEKIATREVDKIIGEYSETELSTAIVESLEEDGYSFIIVHLPDYVLKFNLTFAKQAGIEQAWSILKSDVSGGRPWRAKHGIFEPRRGEWVYGDKINGTIGVLDNTLATQYGEIAEWLLHTPFQFLDGQSIDELEVETMPGHTGTEDASVFVSLTYDGITHGHEWTEMYGLPNDYGKRFIIRRLGYVNDWIGFKLRGATQSRMAFSRAIMTYG